MDLHTSLAKLTRHPVFTEWQSQNKDSFLAHAFVMLDEANKNTWQIGFYNSKNEKMTTFVLDSAKVEKIADQEILKGDNEIKKLAVEDVKLSVEDALTKAKEILDTKYGKKPIMKQFFIIQMIEGKAMFNVTYLLHSFETLNIKIDSKSGELVKDNLQKLAAFG